MPSYLAYLLGVVLEWLFYGLSAVAGLILCGGCSMAASWSAPSQQQVTNPTSPVSQTTTANSPQEASPKLPGVPSVPVAPSQPAAP